MFKEIEILVGVEMEAADALAALASLGEAKAKRTIDRYFTHPANAELEPSPDGALRASFRIRRKDGAAHGWLAYKKDHVFPDGTWSHSDEWESEIAEPDVVEGALGQLGYVPLVTVDCVKHVFTNGEFETVLEEVKDLGLFLEVELKSGEQDVAAGRARIFEFMKGLGVNVTGELHRGKPELLLRKKLAAG